MDRARHRRRRVRAPGCRVQKIASQCAVLVQGYKRNCARCGEEFVVCRPCDRGRRYCIPCAKAERAERVRKYRSVQRRTFRGRRARAARNLRWRGNKSAKKETDHALADAAQTMQGERAASLNEMAGEERIDGIKLAGTLAGQASKPDPCAAEPVGADAAGHAHAATVEPPRAVGALRGARSVEGPAGPKCARCGRIVDELLPDDPFKDSRNRERERGPP